MRECALCMVLHNVHGRWAVCKQLAAFRCSGNCELANACAARRLQRLRGERPRTSSSTEDSGINASSSANASESSWLWSCWEPDAVTGSGMAPEAAAANAKLPRSTQEIKRAYFMAFNWFLSKVHVVWPVLGLWPPSRYVQMTPAGEFRGVMTWLNQ